MKLDERGVYECILKIYEITFEIGDLLNKGDWDGIVEQIEKRAELINLLHHNNNGNFFKFDANEKGQSESKKLVELILNLDEKNVKFIKQRIKDTSKSLAVIIKERHAVENFQAISNMRNTQIINYLHEE